MGRRLHVPSGHRSGDEHEEKILNTVPAGDALGNPDSDRQAGDADRTAPVPGDPHEARRARVHAAVDISCGRGLEVGPLCAPLVSKDEADVYYVDVASTEGLREHYADDPGVKTEDIVDVDVGLYADGRLRPIAEATADVGPFDWVVASHVIEHVPDVVTWLADVARSLVDDGRLVLVVPDRRYSFDARRPRTTVGQMLQAFEAKDQRPSVRAVYDHLSEAVSLSAHEAWIGVPPTPDRRVHDRELVRETVRNHRESTEYIDCHVWLFTPREFVEQLAELSDLGLLDFVVEELVPTAPYDLEFYVTLRRIPRGGSPTETDALRRAGFRAPPDAVLPGPSDAAPVHHGLPPGVVLRTLSAREARLLDVKRRLLESTRSMVGDARRLLKADRRR
jgi:SAM-dependent methyltransferase